MWLFVNKSVEKTFLFYEMPETIKCVIFMLLLFNFDLLHSQIPLRSSHVWLSQLDTRHYDVALLDALSGNFVKSILRSIYNSQYIAK